MSTVTTRRALLRAFRRRRPATAGEEPPIFWGRIGDYDAVTRSGILLLLSPEPAHPSQRAKNSA